MHKAVINGVELTEEQLKEGLAQIERKRRNNDPKNYHGGEKIRTYSGATAVVISREYQDRIASLWSSLDRVHNIFALDINTGRILYVDVRSCVRID